MLGFWAHEGSFRQAVCQPAIWLRAKGRSTFGALWAARASCGTLLFLCVAMKCSVSSLVYMLLWGVMEWGELVGLWRQVVPCLGVICRVEWLVRAYVLPSLSFIENAKRPCLLCKREIDCVQARFLGIGKRNAPRGVLRPMGALGMVLVLRLKHNKRMRRGGHMGAKCCWPCRNRLIYRPSFRR